MGWPASAACQLQAWGLLSLRNCASQFLVRKYAYLLLVLFLWRTLTNISTINIHWWGPGLELGGLGFYMRGTVLRRYIYILASQLPGITPVVPEMQP